MFLSVLVGILLLIQGGFTAPSSSLVAAHNSVGLRMLAKVPASETNAALSPPSVCPLLALDMAGSDSTTRDELMTLYPGFTPDEVFHAYQRYYRSTRGYDFRAYNLMVVRNNIRIQPQFESLATEQFSTAVWNRTFTPALADELNGWFSKCTDGLIRDMARPGMFNRLSRLVLANAVLLNGTWREGFPPHGEDEYDGLDFYDSNSNSVEGVEFMSCAGGFQFLQSDRRLCAVRKAYNGGASMVILMPGLGGLSSLVSTLDASLLDSFFTELKKSDVNPEAELFMPKFDLSVLNDMTSLTKALGIEQIYLDGDNVGMRKITDEPLFVDTFLQKVRVQVDEDGTKMAAATMQVMGIRGLGDPPPPPEIYIDHPFLWFIMDDASGEILALGWVKNPLG